EIMRRASSSTGFSLTAGGGFNFGLGSGSTQTTFSRNQSNESSSSKKSFQEAVVKAAESYRGERRLEVEVTSADEDERTTSREISNPNTEITVTYLFHELELRYRLTEHLRGATPVILVAQEIPATDEITDGWLLEHAWIIKRALLDDDLAPILDELT